MSCDPRSFGRCRQGRGRACGQSVIKITIIVAPWPLTFWDSVLLLARWRTKLGAEDVVLVDRPGRGYGDDYSPWLVDAPLGELVRVRGAAVSEEGILAA